MKPTKRDDDDWNYCPHCGTPLRHYCKPGVVWWVDPHSPDTFTFSPSTTTISNLTTTSSSTNAVQT